MTIAKFGKLEHLQELKSGILFMNGINYFRKLEEKERGDASDGMIKQFQPKISIEIYGEMREIPGITSASFYDSNNYPIFCSSLIDENFLSDKNILKTFKKYFGEYIFVFEDYKDFFKNLENSCNEQNHYCTYRPVKYIDYSSKNDIEILNNIKGNFEENIFEISVFCKDIAFKYQNEFRIVLHNNELTKDTGYFKFKLQEPIKEKIYRITNEYNLEIID